MKLFCTKPVKYSEKLMNKIDIKPTVYYYLFRSDLETGSTQNHYEMLGRFYCIWKPRVYLVYKILIIFCILMVYLYKECKIQILPMYLQCLHNSSVSNGIFDIVCLYWHGSLY